MTTCDSIKIQHENRRYTITVYQIGPKGNKTKVSFIKTDLEARIEQLARDTLKTVFLITKDEERSLGIKKEGFNIKRFDDNTNEGKNLKNQQCVALAIRWLDLCPITIKEKRESEYEELTQETERALDLLLK